MKVIEKMKGFPYMDGTIIKEKINELFNPKIFENETFLTSDIFSRDMNRFAFFFITTHLIEPEWKMINELRAMNPGGELYFHEIYPVVCRECYRVTNDVTYQDLLKNEYFDLYLINSSGGMDYLIFSDLGDWAIYSSHRNVSILAFRDKISSEMKKVVSPYVEDFDKVVSFLKDYGTFDESIFRRYKVGYLTI